MRLLSIALGHYYALSPRLEAQWVNDLQQLASQIEQALRLNDVIETLAEGFVDKQHALFLGRGAQYPVAMEGALKLKEISYIHAEAYPAGELKHGPLALVDEDMPVVRVLPKNGAGFCGKAGHNNNNNNDHEATTTTKTRTAFPFHVIYFH